MNGLPPQGPQFQGTPKRIDWSKSEDIYRLWNEIQKRFLNKECVLCHGHETEPFISNFFGRNVVILSCEECGHSRIIARIKE